MTINEYQKEALKAGEPERSMQSRIQVVLKDGTFIDFDRKCTNVNYNNDKFCMFTNENGKEYLLLALIPYENIAYISNYPYQEARSYE